MAGAARVVLNGGGDDRPQGAVIAANFDQFAIAVLDRGALAHMAKDNALRPRAERRPPFEIEPVEPAPQERL